MVVGRRRGKDDRKQNTLAVIGEREQGNRVLPS
jgi:hypothetical protein